MIVLAAEASPQSADFTRLFAQYRGTDADRAVREFANWSETRLLREAKLPESQNDQWALAALALFHLEADLHRMDIRRGFQRPESDTWFALRPPSHFTIGQTVLERRVIPAAKRTADQKLLAFCRDWYVVLDGLQFLFENFPEAGQSARRHLGQDPQIQLLFGIRAAAFMGPRAAGGRFTLDWQGWPFRPVSVLGEVYNGRMADDAEKAFGQALRLDPALVEARLRLGRVYQLTNRLSEAAVEFERALLESDVNKDPISGYLAAMFLGELHENAGRSPEAQAAYRRAIERYPEGTVARLALGQAFLSAGRDEEGWAMMRTAFGDGSRRVSYDPWVVYPTLGYWQIPKRLSALRAQVSATPVAGAAAVSAAGGTDVRVTDPESVPVFRPASSAAQFRTSTDGVRVDVLVTNDNLAVPGLTAEDFLVTDNGVRQAVTSATSAGSLAAVIVVDTSASLTVPSARQHVRVATEALRQALAPGDIVSLVSASERVALRSVQVRGGDFLATLLESVRGESRGLTALWDAVLASSSLVAEAPGKAVVLVISDGVDNASWFRRHRALPRLTRLGITVDSIEVPYPIDVWTNDIAFGETDLQQALARSTGGVTFSATDSKLIQKLSVRFDALRQSYLLMYTPQGVAQADGWHEIKVMLRPGAKGSVKARPGYYSPPINK